MKINSEPPFVQNFSYQDILISFASIQRTFLLDNQVCNYDFEGPGFTLAHAYFSYENDHPVEIHVA